MFHQNQKPELHRCFICKKNGRLSHGMDYYAETNPVPVIRYDGWSRDCCKKHVWVHDKKQPNPSHTMDCHQKLKQLRSDRWKAQLCFVCGKRMYYNWIESGAIGAVVAGGLFMVGKMAAPKVHQWWISLLIGTGITFACGVSVSLVIGIYFWYNCRHSDLPDDDTNE